MYHYTDGGLRNVWLKNGYEVKDTPYGKGVSFRDLDGLVKVICLAIVNKQSKITGAEFRYVRSSMLLSQKTLGQMLGYTEQAIAKWEKTGKIPKTVEFYFRSIYIARHNGNQKISTMIDTANIIDRIANTKIIVSEKGNKWSSKIEVEAKQCELEPA